ncbi:MAG: RNA polymerase sigma factor RpoH [Proteobacteria bacterium]|nr:RNA polymerase sigma factor RpoH [Pseudomonadota bacterium]
MNDNGLTHYLEEARRFPMLSPEHEHGLAVAWRDARDRDALRQLVGSHLRFAIKIARGYAGYGLPIADLIAEGNVGLMQAAEKFDPDRGFRFATYAMWWIRAAIQEYILHNASMVKMGTTAAQKKLFFNLRKLKARLQQFEQGDLSPEVVAKIAAELAVPEHDVIEMNRRLGAADRSLNVTLSADSDSEWLELLADERPGHDSVLADADELAERRAMLEQAMAGLNARERHILSERRLKEEPLTLEELSRHYDVSRERIRQIEARAFEKLQKAMMRTAANQIRPADLVAA